jgi:hypothetical protein
MTLLNGWNFWSFTSWTPEQTSAFWTALGAIATVCALWYALWQGWKNSKKINDLAQITQQLSDQNKLIIDQNKLIVQQNELLIEQNQLQKLEMKNEVRPNLTSAGSSTNGSEGSLRIKITNNGHRAIITNIEYKEEYVIFTKKETPISFQGGAIMDINGQSNGKSHISHSSWAFFIHFHDAYKNTYQYYIQGTGNNIEKQGTSDEIIS